jgi:hypothetical protein
MKTVILRIAPLGRRRLTNEIFATHVKEEYLAGSNDATLSMNCKKTKANNWFRNRPDGKENMIICNENRSKSLQC